MVSNALSPFSQNSINYNTSYLEVALLIVSQVSNTSESWFYYTQSEFIFKSHRPEKLRQNRKKNDLIHQEIAT